MVHLAQEGLCRAWPVESDMSNRGFESSRADRPCILLPWQQDIIDRHAGLRALREGRGFQQLDGVSSQEHESEDVTSKKPCWPMYCRFGLLGGLLAALNGTFGGISLCGDYLVMNQFGKGVYGEVTRAEHMCLARNRSWLALKQV